jgi:hypothetical protein
MGYTEFKPSDISENITAHYLQEFAVYLRVNVIPAHVTGGALYVKTDFSDRYKHIEKDYIREQYHMYTEIRQRRDSGVSRESAILEIAVLFNYIPYWMSAFEKPAIDIMKRIAPYSSWWAIPKIIGNALAKTAYMR